MHFMYFSQRIRARLIVNKALNKCCINKKNIDCITLAHVDVYIVHKRFVYVKIMHVM